MKDSTIYHLTGPAVDDFAKGSRVAFRFNTCTATSIAQKEKVDTLLL